MNIYIALDIVEGAYGGSHKFLGTLRDYFRRHGRYAESPEDADAILFNSCQNHFQVARQKLLHPNKIFIQRVDGHPNLYNHAADPRGAIINAQNALLADGSIFQSDWSHRVNKEMGLQDKPFETVILNAPNHVLFHGEHGAPPPKADEKLKVIISSWSPNANKGFPIYQWLDEHLDFDRYEVTFVGNSPIRFNNIKMIPPQPPEGVARLLRAHNVFLFASRLETCSNALIEAMHCGLPALALNDGGNPEIVGQGGELFVSREEIPQLLEKIKAGYEGYKTGISLPSLDEVGNHYLDFFDQIQAAVVKQAYRPLGTTFLQRLRIRKQLEMWRAQGHFTALKRRIGLLGV